jgi:hypothetical protein
MVRRGRVRYGRVWYGRFGRAGRGGVWCGEVRQVW